MYLSAEKLGSGALLAPMAGVADRAMRELCMGFGAIGCIGEMASSKGISMNDRKTSELLSLSEAERPAGVQIFGDVPEIMAKSIETCMKYSPDFIDINMGCPAPKVAGNGGGSALMKRPELAAEIVARCVEVSPVPITVKMRAGWDEDSINAPELAVLCEQAGAAAITVHGRTRKQMYAPPVDLGVIAEVKRRVGTKPLWLLLCTVQPAGSLQWKYRQWLSYPLDQPSPDAGYSHCTDPIQKEYTDISLVD